ncbi:metallophosphoesterase 1-like [Harmonia axyridis]|uniref:metallophosphoesterase 1-like n=1 Tax=Harmonia axyridis TaxID=115357 RepID=UPI001E2794D5|nr:metallophosphoesterase 1-like [Harmonia axyridis]
MISCLLKKTWRFLHIPFLFAYSLLYKFRIIIAEVSLGFLVLVFYCEYLHYNVVIQQCYWPRLSVDNEDFSIPTTNDNRLKVMLIADLHLKCKRSNWYEIFSEEVQMERCFQHAVHQLKPDVIFILGDVLDQGMHCNLKDFDNLVQRFERMFSLPNRTKMYVVPGNRDIGYHHQIDVDQNKDFADGLKSPLVQHLMVKKNNFILLNSMTLGDDSCSLCSVVEEKLAEIEKRLKCSQEEYRGTCDQNLTMPIYSRPILIQHLPLYRTSDENCSDSDSAPWPQNLHEMAEYWECLSQNTTDRLLQRLKPRIVFSGHLHHGCTRRLPQVGGIEVTISSFNWRKKDKPAIGLAVVTTTNYEIVKCQMPRYATIITIYLLGILVILFWIVYSHETRRIFVTK